MHHGHTLTSAARHQRVHRAGQRAPPPPQASRTWPRVRPGISWLGLLVGPRLQGAWLPAEVKEGSDISWTLDRPPRFGLLGTRMPCLAAAPSSCWYMASRLPAAPWGGEASCVLSELLPQELGLPSAAWAPCAQMLRAAAWRALAVRRAVGVLQAERSCRGLVLIASASAASAVRSSPGEQALRALASLAPGPPAARVGVSARGSTTRAAVRPGHGRRLHQHQALSRSRSACLRLSEKGPGAAGPGVGPSGQQYAGPP